MSRQQPARRAKKQKTAKEAKESECNPVLPAEIFAMLIGHMEIRERIVCRAVCQYFKQVVDRIKVRRSLVIAESEDSTCEPIFGAREDHDFYYFKNADYERFLDQFYFVSNDPVYESDVLISPDTCAGLRILMKQFDLCELRRLFIVEAKNGRNMVDLLNELVQLEHLQISSINFDCDLRLKLPNLHTLSIVELIHRPGFHLFLATKNLKNFETMHLRRFNFRFEYPRSVTLVKVQDFDDALYELQNLEVLICEYVPIEYDDDFEKDDDEHIIPMNFGLLPKLQRVDCAHGDPKDITEMHYLCHHASIDFYYCGLKIESLWSELGYFIDRGEEDELVRLLGMHHMFDDYEYLADHLYFFDAIRYQKNFITFFPDRLPENFASKFYGVRDIYVDGKIENVDYFVQFLRCFKSLKVVWLTDTFLDNEFFDRYAHLFGRVHEFHYRHDISNPPLKVDLKLIFNFKYLENFCTDQPIQMNLITEAFGSLRYFKCFRLENIINFERSFEIELVKNKFTVLCLDPRKDCKVHEFTSKPKMLKFVEKHFPFLSQQTITG